MTTEVVLDFKLRGGNKLAYDARDKEILVSGPAGTGKTRTILELINNLCHQYAGLRVLIVRKHQVTLTSTCLVTLNAKVLTELDHVEFFGGSKSEPAAYRYPNGSIITVGGMDNPEKVLSSEYDIIYPNEATELTLEDWEILTSRLRNGVLKHMRIIGDCNPSSDRHWLLARCNAGRTRHIRTRIQDNPAYFDDDGEILPAGEGYLATLENLTGARRARLLEGVWIGMENAIYEALDRDKHLVPVPEGWLWSRSAIGVDYGTVHISAVVVVSLDTTGRYWVRECWTGGEDEQAIENAVNSFKVRYGARVGIVDPIPAMQMLANRLVFKRSGTTTQGSRGGEGSRIANVLRVKTLLGNDALRFDIGGVGVNDLFGEALDYKWLHKDTENIEKYIVDRHNDDRVAAMEYAIEALLTIPGGQPTMQARGTSYERTPDTTRRGAGRRPQQEPITHLGGQA